ncbi:hypothetical protein GCM10011409_37820 [Lentibacillus populi]|uniref:Uncharacterized protein n=1 Tax=Lentibacillus populi TaxID=1827502 RepID=A0A9W5U1A4_9BACI|nr:hypothetical protein GCM10011409_37820 [Lentibacillus populi]
MEYSITIIISVGLVYALGIIGMVGLICQVWIWMIDKVTSLIGVKSAIIKFILSNRNTKEAKANRRA